MTNSSPLFFYALCYLLGAASQLLFHPAYLITFAFLFVFWKGRILSGLATFTTAFFLAAQIVSLPSLPEEGIEGSGIFMPESVSYTHSPFGTSYMIKGTLQQFHEWKRVPCQVYIPLHHPRPPANHALYVEGRLLPKTFPQYVLKLIHWQPLKTSLSLAEWRFQVKDWVRRQFASLFQTPETASFLLSMVTGDIDDRLMALQFNRLGLLHLLGVSGFQFSLLALLLGALLRTIFSSSKGAYLLIFLLTAYAFILGTSPPIQRAWISCTLYTIARLAGLQITALNALGAALLWQLFLDPCVIFHLGFQFSFLCTAAIFTVYPPLRNLLKRWLPDRHLSDACKLSIFDRVGYILAFLSRETLSLNLAIHLVSLPLIFYHFHKFPLLSLAYNLFLPGAVSLAYLFLIPGLILNPLSHLLAFPFLKISQFLTDTLLIVATNPPTLFDFQWRIAGFGLGWAVLSLTALFGIFLGYSSRSDNLFISGFQKR